ncbi:LytTR family DNA-binding domain-containing protein [Algoriphagus sp. D3-2-R+10]|uniref:LytR/AlgR family response regulator transcription factor n=1 Tax=Algoriphagus aurantiacus TaxID=3103948 RepID=UPI002B39D1F3|nr:LytTR family DNA-binding domain-containing protein [Algoriphagus sp. D3-2-R+10]MEB2774048.1 LytTR family DNA-binding domain-containing protein [Algoriphagus sp. D3-2-R+10]
MKFNLPEHFIACVVVRMGLLISLVYFHLNVLVPRFFKTRQFLKYAMVLLLSLGIYVSLQNLYDIYLYGFVIGDIRSRDFWSAFPYNFFTTLWYLALTAGLKLSLERYEDIHKPELILSSLDKVSDEGQERQVFLKSGTKQLMVDLDSITHIKGLKDYSIVYTTEDQIIVKGSLKNAENLLGAKKLVRVHKSYLVALDRIRTIQGNQIILDTHSIPIGRSYKKELYKLLMPS